MNRKIRILITLLFFLLTNTESTYSQSLEPNKEISLELISTTKAIFLNPSFSYRISRHYPYVGLLIGRHHTLNGDGLGLNLGDSFFPNGRNNRFNLFFTGSYHVVSFRNLSSSSLIENILVNQLTFGYGVECNLSKKISIHTSFSLGFLVEKRNFIQPIEKSSNYDTAGILSIGINYKILN